MAEHPRAGAVEDLVSTGYRPQAARSVIAMHANSVTHHRLDLDGVEIFYRAAGPQDAPVVLLPHGYPCSSYEFRAYMPLLADRWRLVAPDFPGCGYSATPDGFPYDFDGYADFLKRFTERLGIERFTLYLHDFGSQIGLRFAIAHPQRITALILQNGDIYEDQLGPKYAALQQFFTNPTPQMRAELADAVSLKGFEEEFLNEVDTEIAMRIPPDLWHLHWALMTPRRREIATNVIAGLKDNLAWFPRYQAYLREHQPPTLIVWGPCDGYMPKGSAQAYLRDLPNAELHLFDDGGHWLLETHLEQVADLSRDFLERVHNQQ
jgi:pimeloyl-ACP methyl ester carboxylesterase